MHGTFMRPHHSGLPAAFLALVLLTAACAPSGAVDEQTLAPENESTKIFAADGTLITTLRQEENREIIPIDQIPVHLRNAVVAIEDARFYTHRGFDAKAILRALYANARSGKVVEGGSTITQQLVRNSIEDVGREQTLERKVKEATYAYRVETTFSKEKILELYLNTVYFGEGAYGVQTASQTYFGKDVKDLTLGESALLAGMIKAPVTYNPYSNVEASLTRRNRVLDRMFQLRMIAEAESSIAKGAELGVRAKPEFVRYRAPYFVDHVTRQIQHSDAFSALGESVADRANRLFRGGLRVYTTLDLTMQAAAEEAVARVLDHPDDDPSAALVAIDPKTGHVKALVGGKDYFASQEEDPCVKVGAVNDDGTPKTCAKVNLALGREGGGSGRQSGSAFKPFVLAQALSEGRRLSDVYPASACIEIPGADAGKPWRVCNYEESDFGSSLSVRDATVKSVNVVYAQMIMDVGARDVVQLAKKMGVESPLSPVPSAALGANAVSPLDMASAFGAFPTLGVHARPIAVTRITDARGNVLWKAVEEKRQVLNPGVAYLSTQVMQEVIERGTAARNGKIGRPAFGKTGTAQEWRDGWFVGGAGTDLVAAVAVFWPDGEIEMKPSCGGDRTTYAVEGGKAQPPGCRPTRLRVTGGGWPAQIWQRFMLGALEGVPASTFPVPEVEIVRVEVDVTRGCRPNPYTPRDLVRTLTFIKGTEPAGECTEPTGPAVATVPSVVGFPDGQAQRLLTQAGFRVTTRDEPSESLPPGRVTRQSPAPGTEVASGSEVTIWISSAAPAGRVTVPDVVNLSEKDARQALEKAGLKVEVVRHPTCSKGDSKCFVWDQNPDGGDKVGPESEVTIYVKQRPGG